MRLSKIPIKDLFSPTKWRIFAKYLVLRALKKKYPEFKVPEYREQIVYRMNKCPECVIAKQCVHCTCTSPELFYDKDNWCEMQRWKKMVLPKMWEIHKRANGITINPDNLKELEQFGEVKWQRKKKTK